MKGSFGLLKAFPCILSKKKKDGRVASSASKLLSFHSNRVKKEKETAIFLR